MPWEKTFDIDEAIDKATNVFWAKGYQATSLSDLIAATGVNKGSFYNAFGSKKQLFIRSLLKYEKEQRKDVLSQLELLAEPIEAISTLFDSVIEQGSTDKERKGCFLVNTALDLPNHDEDTRSTVTTGLKGTEEFFKKQVELGISKSLIPQTVDPVLTSKGLLTLLIGLRVLSRGVYDQQDLINIKTQALNLLK